MAVRVLEVNEECIPKERPPVILPVPMGKEGDVIVEHLPFMMRFEIFGRKKTLGPRSVTLMSRIESLKVTDNILGAGQREERKLLSLGSDHPEEVYRYWNYARLAHGKVLVYRLGLGLFSRMASPRSKEMTVIEPDSSIRHLVERGFENYLDYPSASFHIVPGDLSVFSKAANRYDFIFIDPVPYTGSSASMLTINRLPELNSMIGMAKKMASRDGMIAVRGYRDLISKYQQHCQELIWNIRMNPDYEEKIKNLSSMDQLFHTWAQKNRKRVLEKMDYKFSNAWARHTALTVT